MSVPQHCGRNMYRDRYDGQDMKRWICTEPGCASAISDETLAAVADMAFAFDNGIQLPGTTIINVGGEPA